MLGRPPFSPQIAPVLSRMPNKIQITGHTAWPGVSGRDVDGGAVSHWRLSAERAISVHEALSPAAWPRIASPRSSERPIREPLIADDPSLSVNRRVSILLLKGEAPMPDGMGP